MSKTVVFFRGRNTAAIVEDARKLNLLSHDDKIIIVKRLHDSLAEPGDLPDLPLPVTGELVVVCNGGTTQQQVPTIAKTMLHCMSSGTATRLVEVLQEEVRELWTSCGD